MLFFFIGMFMIPFFIFVNAPGWITISYSILLAAKIISEGK